MFCRHCGKSIIDDSKFCRFCGLNVEEIKSTQSDQNNENKYKDNKIIDGILIKFETDNQLFGIKVINIISILYYLSIIFSSISVYVGTQLDYIDEVYLSLIILFFGGFVYLSSLALYAYNRKRFYTLPVMRASLVLFSILIGFIPTGLIIVVIFWRRLSLPILKSYLADETEVINIESEIQQKPIFSEIKKIKQKKILSKDMKIFLTCLVLLIITVVSFFSIGYVYFNVAGKLYDQRSFIESAYSYKIATNFLIPNAKHNMNLALEPILNDIRYLINTRQFEQAKSKTEILKNIFPESKEIKDLEEYLFNAINS